MTSTNKIKVLLFSVFTLFLVAWAVSGTVSQASGDSIIPESDSSTVNLIANANPDDLVGSETCKACHEDQFKKFTGTKHAKLQEVASWKDKAQGCESCHGPGKLHVEGGGDKTKIISFTGKNSKQISETCLGCHAGKESHNNFRRGEHWRNDIGCTDCHSSHGSLPNNRPSSITEIGQTTVQNAGNANDAMLIKSEPQLCIGCHTETKAQFAKPFHHKVLEGAMKCSDCHNAHGGFESKQTRLSVGADASCIKCHGDKQGPFAFEHAPLKTEGCSSCHTPHGSANPKLLSRNSIRQLCLECHSNLNDVEGGAPQTPHNQTQTRYLACTVCHTRIHGSNASRLYFR